MSGTMLTKICGIKETETLTAMIGLPVHYVGFMFAPSKRRVSPERAAELLATARKAPMANGRPPLAVGVFVNPSFDELDGVLAKVALDVVQLHGDETPAFCREVGEKYGVEVWRAFPVAEPDQSADASRESPAPAGPERIAAYADAVSAILLDTAGGGTGRVFRWDLIPAYREAASRHGLKLFIAGGLEPGNVGNLMSSYDFDGVDISSGVETDGAKDIVKIAAFAERVSHR